MRKNHSTPTFTDFLFLLGEYPGRWLLPTVVVTGLAVIGAYWYQGTWLASQALSVRNETVVVGESHGRVRHDNEMKITQETLLELVYSRDVLTAAWNHVVGADPTDAEIDDLISKVRVKAPKGSEFGLTEVFYVQARDADRERAAALCGAICEQLDRRFQQLRSEKARRLDAETAEALNVAKTELAASAVKLTELEKAVGPDLAELRILHQAPSDSSQLRRRAVELETAIKDAQTARLDLVNVLNWLGASTDDPTRLLSAPSRVLETQPALRRLRDGLVDVQLKNADLRGKMAANHPAVKAVEKAEGRIAASIHGELTRVTKTVEADLHLASSRVELLRQQHADVQRRLNRLAELRADYSNLVNEVSQRTDVVAQAQRRYSDALSQRAGVESGSLITHIGSVDTGARAQGPRPAVILGGGVIAGLFCGVGLLLLTAPSANAAAGRSTQPSGNGRFTAPAGNGDRPTIAELLHLNVRRPGHS